MRKISLKDGDTKDSISSYIHAIRVTHGFNQTQFAEFLGVSLKTVVNWETQRYPKSWVHLWKLFSMGVKTEWGQLRPEEVDLWKRDGGVRGG